MLALFVYFVKGHQNSPDRAGGPKNGVVARIGCGLQCSNNSSVNTA
jgi:hypothetical protein